MQKHFLLFLKQKKITTGFKRPVVDVVDVDVVSIRWKSIIDYPHFHLKKFITLTTFNVDNSLFASKLWYYLQLQKSAKILSDFWGLF